MEVILKTFKPCDLDHPGFGNNTMVHDWRNHIDEQWIPIWKNLPLKLRVWLVMEAEEKAHAEEWE